jgi:hypothetical protein
VALTAPAGTAPGKVFRGVAAGSYAPFRPVRALACDLFPHADHCEAILLLERD